MQIKLNENIKKYRKSMNLTQEELAEAFGVTVGAVSKWESGSNVPDILSLEICRAKLYSSITRQHFSL